VRARSGGGDERLTRVEVTIFGNALHLLTSDEVEDGRIASDLERASGARVDVRAIEASLEDVFVRLTRLQQERNGGDREDAA
jgi:hypothetical protein